jgi:HEAT repeat protein
MDLHFCSQCGISIPQYEIDTGAAKGAGGKYFCNEHRGGAVAIAESPRPAGAGGQPGTSSEPELLFCANCQVSIPLGDAQSGRARREFGSMLCAGCSKSDPGERAARREAVEAEMASDVRSSDAVVARRCSVCSAAVPYAQIVTGKAKVEGNRVVCERCHAAAVAAPTASGGGWSSNFVLVIVVVGAGLLGYFATIAYQDYKNANATKAPPVDPNAALRSDIDKRLAELDARLADVSKRVGDPSEKAAADKKNVDAAVDDVRRQVKDLTEKTSNADMELQQRIAKLEGQVNLLTDMVRGLAARSPAPSAVPPTVAPPPDKPPAVEKPTATEPTKKDAPAVNPDVAKFCKDLRESGDDGIRFTAANELAKLKDPSSIPALVQALADDKHYFVRRGCARALGAIKAWLAVPNLIKALEDREVYVALQANQALQNITGNDFGVTQDTPAGQRKTKAQAAEKWWEKNKDHPPDGVCMHALTD